MSAEPPLAPDAQPINRLRVRRLGIDTYRHPVIYMRADCPVCRSEGFEAQSRVEIHVNSHSITATLNVVHGDILVPGEVGLSEWAWNLLGAQEGEFATFSHARTLDSMGFVRAKVYGEHLHAAEIDAIVQDVVAGHYSDVHLAAFITACSGDHLQLDEIVSLTQAMVATGERLQWPQAQIMDKHCVGGLPGNRTSPLVVAMVTAAGLIMPKTSSRAITSPAGTADTMETLCPVELDLPTMRRVVEQVGGCLVWGGAVHLSPADDILIRVERTLDLDSEGQMVASVLSKKASAGSTHVLIDIPVGPSAKVRTPEAGRQLARLLEEVGLRLGLTVRVLLTDGSQPVGRGVGPALEAHDILATLQGLSEAPDDLRQRAVLLAGRILELSGKVEHGEGEITVAGLLTDGSAWRQFQRICEAQGGMREPPRARWTHPVVAARAGTVLAINNRQLARVAKLAGAPISPAAGLYIDAKLGENLDKGQPLFTVHAESPGELEYALEYVRRHPDIFITSEHNPAPAALPG